MFHFYLPWVQGSFGTQGKFYSASSDKPLPGQGSGETTNEESKLKYMNTRMERSAGKFSHGSFEVDGKTWNTVVKFLSCKQIQKEKSGFS